MSGEKFREIERLRGVAILLAILNHEPLHTYVPTFCGVVGVHLFFVISGFVITRSLVGLLPAFEPGSRFRHRLAAGELALRAFFIRRFFRIVPLALLSVAVVAIAATVSNESKVWNRPMDILLEAFSAFTLTYNYTAFAIGRDIMYFWSLNVEEHFYLVLPFLFLVLPTSRARLRLAVGTALFVALVLRPITAPNTLVNFDVWRYHFLTHARIDTLAAGVALALLYDAGWLRRPRASHLASFLGKLAATLCLAALVFTHQYFHVSNQWGWTIIGLAALGLVLTAVQSRGYVLNTPVVSHVFEYLGSRSYAIYLLHLPLWNIIGEFLTVNSYLRNYYSRLEFTLVWAVCVLVAAELSCRLIEQPLTRMGRRLTPIEPSSKEADPTPARRAA